MKRVPQSVVVEPAARARRPSNWQTERPNPKFIPNRTGEPRIKVLGDGALRAAAVLAGRQPDPALEGPVEVALVVETAIHGDLAQRL